MSPIALFQQEMSAALQFAGEPVRMKFLEFFTAQIRNSNTRRSYAKAALEFLRWCEQRGACSLEAITPIRVAGWIQEMAGTHTAPTVKQRLAAIRHLLDWLVVGQVMSADPPIPCAARSIPASEGKRRSCLRMKPASCSTASRSIP